MGITISYANVSGFIIDLLDVSGWVVEKSYVSVREKSFMRRPLASARTHFRITREKAY